MCSRAQRFSCWGTQRCSLKDGVQPLAHSTVTILVWLFLELNLFILATLSGVWNVSVLMKSTGLVTSGYSRFSRGNIQASRATAHLEQGSTQQG